jgi:excisionase family DNA binding protein
MLTVKRAAEILSISPGLVYALCAQGKLEHERYGLGRGTIRIPESALADFRAAARPAPRMKPAQRPAAIFRHLDSQRLTQAWRERGVELPSPPPR